MKETKKELLRTLKFVLFSATEHLYDRFVVFGGSIDSAKEKGSK